jgi:SEC-C motif
MSYFETWNKRIEEPVDQTQYTAYVQQYYDLEKEAYDRILKNFPDNTEYLSGTAKDLANRLGFKESEMEVFVGFVDGINPSLTEEQKPEEIVDDTQISLAIDYEKLYFNMHDAKADWLYELPSWNNVFSKERRAEIAKEYRESKTVHVEKIGRNDPCPCGSGKKFKKCCMGKES